MLSLGHVHRILRKSQCEFKINKVLVNHLFIIPKFLFVRINCMCKLYVQIGLEIGSCIIMKMRPCTYNEYWNGIMNGFVVTLRCGFTFRSAVSPVRVDIFDAVTTDRQKVLLSSSL